MLKSGRKGQVRTPGKKEKCGVCGEKCGVSGYQAQGCKVREGAHTARLRGSVPGGEFPDAPVIGLSDLIEVLMVFLRQVFAFRFEGSPV